MRRLVKRSYDEMQAPAKKVRKLIKNSSDSDEDPDDAFIPESTANEVSKHIFKLPILFSDQKIYF